MVVVSVITDWFAGSTDGGNGSLQVDTSSNLLETLAVHVQSRILGRRSEVGHSCRIRTALGNGFLRGVVVGVQVG